MRVAYFTESLPPLTDGVARTYTWLAKALNHQKVECRFFSPCLPQEEEPWRWRVQKVPSFAFPLYRYYRVAWPSPKKIRQELDAFRPDLVQVAAPTPLSILGQNYALARGLPCVSSYHTHFVNYFPYYNLGALQGLGWAFLRWFHNRGQRTYVPSPSAARELEARGFKNLAIWSRGLDAEKFSPAHYSGALKRKLAPGGELLGLYVGRLVKDKDLDVLARALKKFRAKGHKIRMAFAGDGPYRRSLKRRLKGDHFLGFQHGQQLSALYASADVFTFPSTNETFGNVVLEAFSSQVAVLAADAGGPADLIRHGKNGLLARPRDASDFAVQLARLAEEPGLRSRLALQGAATARSFHWLAVHGSLIRDYQGLVAGFKPRPGLAALSPA